MRYRLIEHEIPDMEVAGLITVLRERIDEVAHEAVAAIAAELPVLVRPHEPQYAKRLNQSVSWTISGFIDLMEDDETSQEDIKAFFREYGAWISEQGLGPEVWETAFRVGTGVTISRLSEVVQGHPGVTTTIIGLIAQRTMGYVDDLASAMRAGYSENAAAAAEGERRRRRRQLLELLLSRDPAPKDIERLAEAAQWPAPRSAAAIALLPRDNGLAPEFHADTLIGTYDDRPCAIVYDPDGPGRRAAYTRELHGWSAAVGPTVPLTELARSLAWARETLDLFANGDGGPLWFAVDNIPLLQAARDPYMSAHLVTYRLAPLMTLPRTQRQRLAVTLQHLLQSGFRAVDVADRLYVHPQTIRYRLRQLDELFGPALRNPHLHLEYSLALHYLLNLPLGEQNPEKTRQKLTS
ncbi:helix-turn-helix domain-containing protein [Actinomadura barringtoniae]|uniref:Helix-turn-helix domain-containing protein n=1 Tax=Actinomadura barringtoniae TaxID=1427535 RepID=A0A939T3C4_9ACTN|nr:helix-turn-helix domain-containing protein [Actinomadura barringtoniae]MBO2447908.1 helix-turn-helix domain-containing protein [Actinomadura barringtoniae]